MSRKGFLEIGNACAGFLINKIAEIKPIINVKMMDHEKNVFKSIETKENSVFKLVIIHN